MARSPLPWEQEDDDSLGGVPFIPIVGFDGEPVCEVSAQWDEPGTNAEITETSRANAALIVECVNGWPAAQARIAELTEIRAGTDRMIKYLDATNVAAHERIARLVAALKPFAVVANAFDQAVAPAPHRDEHGVHAWQTMQGSYEISVGHFRAARAVLEDGE